MVWTVEAIDEERERRGDSDSMWESLLSAVWGILFELERHHKKIERGR